MSFSRVSDLQARVLNCLQTILELELELKQLTLSSSMLKDFEELKDLVARIDDLALKEEEVLRIERATAQFLEELKEPLALVASSKPPSFLQ
ncbi:MAG: hypothetical protein PHO79_00010 [Desulfoplanes sp.]|nr:hypothetical protein [Desulfoplanes sp.]